MKFGVIVFPGSNCDQDCFSVIRDVLRQSVEYVWHKDIDVSGFDCLVLPGGFSYGDYLRTGAVARFSPVMQPVKDFARRGGLVIGICNGFQILLEAGLLPGVMLRNTNMHFICSHVYIKVANTDTPFTRLYQHNQVLRIPIAHNEGNYYIDEENLAQIKKSRQIVLRYCDKDGVTAPESNPNGALDNIAGVVNARGNVLGLMPHPERSAEDILGSSDGFPIFQSIVQWLKDT